MFQSKIRITVTLGAPADGNAKKVETAAPLKYLSNFWRTLSLIRTSSDDCVISSATGETKFTRKGTKLYVPVVTLSTKDNGKMIEQLKSGFKRKINWNKYQSKVSKERKKH